MSMNGPAARATNKLDFSVVSRERMIVASIVGNDKHDASVMQRLFNEISDPQRVAALTKAIDALDQRGFAWNNHYIATAEPGHKVEKLRLAGVAGEQFMARTKTIILIGQTRSARSTPCARTGLQPSPGIMGRTGAAENNATQTVRATITQCQKSLNPLF
jgi:hypothetical protein